MPPPPKADAPAAAAPAAAAAAKPEKPAPPPPAPAPEPAAHAAAPAKGLKAWLPVIVAVLVGPAVTWATAEFVLLPRLKKKLELPVVATATPESGGGSEGEKKAGAETNTYDGFQNIVVNLAGTMGTRYLKASFVVEGDAKAKVDVKKIFTENRTKLYDVTLNVLSSLTLADLEEAGAKNVIREKLVSAYNQALGKHVADQVYFSDFVVQ